MIIVRAKLNLLQTKLAEILNVFFALIYVYVNNERTLWKKKIL